MFKLYLTSKYLLIIANLGQFKRTMQMHEESILKFLIELILDSLSKEDSSIPAALNFADSVSNEKLKRIQLNMQELKSRVTTTGERKDKASGSHEGLLQIIYKVIDL